MSTSNTRPPEDGEPFDVEQFARDTVRSVEFGDAIAGVLEDRVIRIEEAVAARWPRRWLLWARLRREIRASVATWPDDYIPRRDFRGRRWEWAAFASSQRYGDRGWKPRSGSAERPAGNVPQDPPADPGEGFLP